MLINTKNICTHIYVHGHVVKYLRHLFQYAWRCGWPSCLITSPWQFADGARRSTAGITDASWCEIHPTSTGRHHLRPQIMRPHTDSYQTRRHHVSTSINQYSFILPTFKSSKYCCNFRWITYFTKETMQQYFVSNSLA